jgi:hypothetical protein
MIFRLHFGRTKVEDQNQGNTADTKIYLMQVAMKVKP